VTVLVVDDEPIVLKLVHAVLTGAGFEVLKATNPQEAIEVFDRHGSPIHLLLSDIRLPGMSGVELGDRLRLACPELRVLLTAGLNGWLIQACVLERGYAFLAKPFTVQRLMEAVHSALNQTAPAGTAQPK
jgi:two-component system cell cycle sensor histidine kinase/response regulator CckA